MRHIGTLSGSAPLESEAVKPNKIRLKYAPRVIGKREIIEKRSINIIRL